MMIPRGQIRKWKLIDNIFLIVETLEDRVKIADGRSLQVIDLQFIMENSEEAHLIRPGDLREWSSAMVGGPRPFIVTDIRADNVGSLLCDVMDEGKIYTIPLSALLMASDQSK